MKSFNALITVFEHQTLRLSDFANYPNTEADFDWLLQQTQAGKLPCFSIGYAGQVVIYVRHYLAVIRLPSGAVIEILPKISKEAISNRIQTRQWVLQMLVDTYGLKTQALAMLSTGQKQHNLLSNAQLSIWLQPLIQIWFGLLLQLPILLPRHYQQATQNNPQAQGKLLIKEQINHNVHRPHYRYTSQQQLDLHPLWGQFFLTALQKLKALGINETALPVGVLQAVETIAISREILPVQQWQTSYQQLKQMLLSSQSQRDVHSRRQLDMAIELAWLILQMQDNLNMPPVLGTEFMPAVMINMQQAFERWVSIKLAESFKGRVQTQKSFTWLQSDEGKAYKRDLKPDVLIYARNIAQSTDSPWVVADVKYKSIERLKQVSPADLYQLYTYQQFLQAQQAWLVYPISEDITQAINLQTMPLSKLQIVEQGCVDQQTRQQQTGQQVIRLIPFDVMTGKLLFDNN
ncbi:MAG: hypothetical protein CSA42_04480 [Gammaproteobacteria bacterium]|nr:MAG: hypothetical protein CSA42_04480 [Gammaproteobacteria bacterium]